MVTPKRASVEPRRARLALAVAALVAGMVGASVDALAQEECLVKVKASSGAVADAGTLCAEAQNKVCVFQLQACVNEADGGCAAAPMKKKVKAKGRCGALGKVQVKPDGSNAVCGSTVDVRVKTKKKGKHEGKCKVRIAVKSTDKPARKDVDKFQLVCKPNPGECPAGGGTTTTTTLPAACITACDCCVLPISELAGCVSR